MKDDDRIQRAEPWERKFGPRDFSVSTLGQFAAELGYATPTTRNVRLQRVARIRGMLLEGLQGQLVTLKVGPEQQFAPLGAGLFARGDNTQRGAAVVHIQLALQGGYSDRRTMAVLANALRSYGTEIDPVTVHLGQWVELQLTEPFSYGYALIWGDMLYPPGSE